MSVNGDLKVWQESWSAGAQTANGACTLPTDSLSGAIFCDFPISTTAEDSAVLSWNEAREATSTSNNCGTLTVDVLGCPVGTTCMDTFGPGDSGGADYSHVRGGGCWGDDAQRIDLDKSDDPQACAAQVLSNAACSTKFEFDGA